MIDATLISLMFVNSMSQIQYTDELVKEYLLFRGFNGTLKSFDVELKGEKEKGFRVDKIVDQIIQYIYLYDLTSLKDLWAHLDSTIFTKLENDCIPAVKKLENSLLKFYLINAAVNNKTEKIIEFFQRITPELHGYPEWKDWFFLPYMKNPEESPIFSVHFTRQWQDTLVVSLHNFLAIVYQTMPMSILTSYEEESVKIKRLQEENEGLKHALTKLQQRSCSGLETFVLSDLMDDFCIIAQEHSVGPENPGKLIKNLIRNLGGGIETSQQSKFATSPIMGRKSIASSHESNHKRHSSKPRLSSGVATPWIKNIPGEAEVVNKRSVSLEARSRSSRSSAREASLDRASKTRQDFLLLSQDEMNDHKSVITECRFNANGSVLGSCDMDGIVKVWSPAPTPRLLSTATFKSSVLCLEWVAKNERYFINGCQQGLITVYDTKEKKSVWETFHEDKIKSLCISSSPTESTFICAFVNTQNSGKLLLYDIKTKKVETSLNLGPGGPYLTASCCRYNHNGQLLIAGCSDGTVRTLDLRHSECIDLWNAHEGAVQAMQLTPDQNACYTLGTDNKLYRHSLNQTKKPVWEALLSDKVTSFTLDQSGNHVLLCGQNGANIYKVIPSGLNLILQLCRSPIVSCDWAIANQCGTCVTATTDGKIKLSTLLMP